MTENPAQTALKALQNGEYAAAYSAIVKPAALPDYMIKGLAARGLKDFAAAEAVFAQSVQRFPDHADFWFNLGDAQEQLEKSDAAASYQRALDLKPNHGLAAGALSQLFLKQRKFEEAESFAQLALKYHPDRAWALNALGMALNELNRFDDAEKAYKEALTIKPGDLTFAYNRANNLADMESFAAALPLFAEARAKDDREVFQRAEALATLYAGDYEKGWKLFEARSAPHITPPCPRYKGEPVAGKKIILVSEQGFGDVIQFCRFGKKLEGAELIWMVQKPLQRLLAANMPGTVLENSANPPQADHWLPILSLLLATNNMQPSDWGAEPYLTAPATPVLPASDKKKIGIVWSGSPTHGKQHQRALPLSVLAPLWKQDAAFFAPFKGAALNDIKNEPITRLDHLITDFADTAALLSQMDAVITVDTSAAHLAGALGAKTHLLLSNPNDWRWGAGGKRAKDWYASMHVLRQETPGDWKGVIQKLAKAL